MKWLSILTSQVCRVNFMNSEFEISEFEINKIDMNRKLFAIYKMDHFEIKDVLDILGAETVPVGIPMNVNNTIFIRDLSKYIITQNLKPNISEQ